MRGRFQSDGSLLQKLLQLFTKMKRKFSESWKASKQPRKQRKYLANAPLHIKKKFVSVNLSKELRKLYKKRNISARKGDTVKIMRGKFKGRQGKITIVKLKNHSIYVESIQVKKQDGSKMNVKLQPSNLQIIQLNLDDNKRAKKLKVEVQKEKKEKNIEREDKNIKSDSKININKEDKK